MTVLPRLLLPSLLTLWFFGLAVGGVSARYAPEHAAVVLLLWALVALAIALRGGDRLSLDARLGWRI